MWEWQAFWQSASTLAIMNTRELNRETLQNMQRGKYNDAKLNVVEINWICQDGLNLASQLAALPGAMTTITVEDRKKCLMSCAQEGEPFRVP